MSVMNRWRLLCTVLTLTGLCACAPPAGETPIKPAAAVQTADLPCASVEQGPPLLVRYAADSLYRPAAVLPTEAGLACLEALSGWLKAARGERWQATVSGEGGYGFEAQAIAEKRRELLERFFLRQGIATQGWDWQIAPQPGAQLELRQATGSP